MTRPFYFNLGAHKCTCRILAPVEFGEKHGPPRLNDYHSWVEIEKIV